MNEKLFNWVSGDKNCLVQQDMTIVSHHDPFDPDELEYIVDRIRSLYQAGGAIESFSAIELPHSNEKTNQSEAEEMNKEIILETHYDVAEVSDEYLSSLTISSLNHIFKLLKEEYEELNYMYCNGNRNEFPPDWYDEFVYPIDYQVSRVKRIISEKASLNDENDSEDY